MAERVRVVFRGNAMLCAACGEPLACRWDEERQVLLAGCATQGCEQYARAGVWPSDEFRLVENPTQTAHTD